MTNFSDPLLHFTASPLDAITLTNEQIQQAIQWASTQSEPREQIQMYLNNLAMLGFESWLNQRDSQLILERNQFKYTLNAVCQLKIDQFKICLLTQGILDDEIVTLPSSAIILNTPATNPKDVPINNEFSSDVAHFYVLVAVNEEQEQISLEGLIRYDQLKAYQQSGQLTLQSDHTYEIPLSWFDFDINHLLLYLSCLDPSAIQLPNLILESDSPNLTVESDLSNLTLESDLTNLTVESDSSNPVFNVRAFLQGELDELTEYLSWLLLPPLGLANAFRSIPTFENLIEELRNEGLFIPDTARPVLQTFNFGELTLQSYALTWLLEDSNEWSLLLILGTPNDQPLPFGLRLQIEDANQILSEQVIDSYNKAYLYSQVIGEPNEQFTVTISFMNLKNVNYFSFLSE